MPSSRSRSQTPEPRNSPVSASEYAMPLMDRIGPSKFNFAGEMGEGLLLILPLLQYAGIPIPYVQRCSDIW